MPGKDAGNFSVALVRAPACGACGEPMKGHGSLQWVCVQDECESGDRPIGVSGVYPFYISDGSPTKGTLPAPLASYNFDGDPEAMAMAPPGIGLGDVVVFVDKPLGLWSVRGYKRDADGQWLVDLGETFPAVPARELRLAKAEDDGE